MTKLLIIGVALFATVWLLRHYNALPPAQRKKFAFKTFIGLVVLVLLVLAVRGKLHWLVAAAAAVLSLLPRILGWIARTWPALQVLHRQWKQTQGAQQTSEKPPRNTGAITANEARKILGVKADASREEVIDAHRRLMQKLHPDRGGSDYLAAKINAAKDVLLR